jgi:hypothetical protein
VLRFPGKSARKTGKNAGKKQKNRRKNPEKSAAENVEKIWSESEQVQSSGPVPEVPVEEVAEDRLPARAAEGQPETAVSSRRKKTRSIMSENRQFCHQIMSENHQCCHQPKIANLSPKYVRKPPLCPKIAQLFSNIANWRSIEVEEEIRAPLHLSGPVLTPSSFVLQRP